MCKASTPCNVATIKGLLVRMLFATHAVICLWRVIGAVDNMRTEDNAMTQLFGDEIKELKYYVVGILGLYLLLTTIECAVIVKRRGGEWKWFSPSVLLYLLLVVPCIWLLEWQMYFKRMEYRTKNNTVSLMTCNTGDFEDLFKEKIVLLGLPEIDEFRSDYGMTAPDWSLGLQQMMLFVLIVGRWLSPKGDITRDQLSQLLLVYIGMAADILEYVTEGLTNSVVMCDDQHVLIVLIVWSVSLFQFTLSPTATKKKSKKRVRVKRNGCACFENRYIFFETEIWSIFVTTFMQDAPFLGTRLYFMFVHKSVNQSSIFFTCKNALLLMMQTYRVAIILLNHCDKNRRLKVANAKNRAKFKSNSKPTRRVIPNVSVSFSRFVQKRKVIKRFRRRQPSNQSPNSQAHGGVQLHRIMGDKHSAGGRRSTLPATSVDIEYAEIKETTPSGKQSLRTFGHIKSYSRHPNNGDISRIFRTRKPNNTMSPKVASDAGVTGVGESRRKSKTLAGPSQTRDSDAGVTGVGERRKSKTLAGLSQTRDKQQRENINYTGTLNPTGRSDWKSILKRKLSLPR